MCRQTFAIVMMLLLFSRIASAQTADSIVTVSSVDFSGDTISARYEIVTHYWKGKEVFKDQTPYATLSSYKFYPDTLNSSEFERYYDDQFRQIKYVQRIAGVFQGYGISTYDAKGRGLMSKTFSRDSTLRDQYTARWIEKKNSLECWYYQNYFSSDENDGIGYSLLDTTYNGHFSIVKSYGVRHNKRVDQGKRPRKKDLIQDYTVVKDKYGRDVEITHFDINGKVSYALNYTYSK